VSRTDQVADQVLYYKGTQKVHTRRSSTIFHDALPLYNATLALMSHINITLHTVHLNNINFTVSFWDARFSQAVVSTHSENNPIVLKSIRNVNIRQRLEI
jgi:hypothetical protein